METRYLNTSHHPAAPRGTVEDSPSPPPAQVNTSVTLSRGSTASPIPVSPYGSKIALHLVKILQNKNKKGSKTLPMRPVKAAGSERSECGFQGMHCVEGGHGGISVGLCAPSKALAGVRKPALNTHLPSVFPGKNITAY